MHFLLTKTLPLSKNYVPYYTPVNYELQDGKIHKIFTESLYTFPVHSILILSITSDKIKLYLTILGGKAKKAGFRPFLCIKMR